MRMLTETILAGVYRFDELSELYKTLLKKAARVRVNAQASQSNYLVGVCVMTESGIVGMGCNVERCTLTQTTHAEQAAIDSIIHQHGTQKIAVVAGVSGPRDADIQVPPKELGPPVTDMSKVVAPCGHCLQIIWENCMGDPSVRLVWLMSNGEVAVTTIGDALPFAFGPEEIGIKL